MRNHNGMQSRPEVFTGVIAPVLCLLCIVLIYGAKIAPKKMREKMETVEDTDFFFTSINTCEK